MVWRDMESSIRVQVSPDPQHAGELGGGSLVERFEDRVNELGASLGEIANRLRDQLDATLAESDDAGWRLNEVELSFSLDLEAEAGVVVAKASTTAGFEASLTWSRV